MKVKLSHSTFFSFASKPPSQQPKEPLQPSSSRSNVKGQYTSLSLPLSLLPPLISSFSHPFITIAYIYLFFFSFQKKAVALFIYLSNLLKLAAAFDCLCGCELTNREHMPFISCFIISQRYVYCCIQKGNLFCVCVVCAVKRKREGVVTYHYTSL